ncbi:hypothetical protein K458DRAFT_474033 [Lentithecium fluviatile CBS 122367]|uniref:RRM domain-containing protein n=1 Tax=Lentithecium fluviatile CBS 122367 TaxID=1168545 RepID=A0A6G1JLD6_9PLEO|nr:hypothetical protein K458DRAFT_474033 [Lentithecium fluviatile CBS 122367]
MAPPGGVNGVIPVTVLQKNAPASTPRGPKAPSPRLKLVYRRLPPGLTKGEFEKILGDEWKVGAGKIDWMNYRKGKVSTDAAKPSKPSRAYIHVTQQTHVIPLGDHVRAVNFQDAAKSFQDPALVGPPTLEFAPYPKMPGNRRRSDARQGTIDQDPEFKEFLESLTAPITKPAAPEEEPQKEKVKTTPLIEALREKKANKDKPQGKRNAKEEAAEKKAQTKQAAATSTDKNRKLTKAEREKAQKEAVKALNNQASAIKDAASASAEKAAPTASVPAPERKRGSVSLAKSMLQRDLGIGPAANRRRGVKRELTPATQETPAKQDENVSGKQKAKEVSTAPAAVVAASEKCVPASPKKERPSRSERRAFHKANTSLVDKTNNKTVVEDSKAQTKPTATPAPTILKKPQAAQTQAPMVPKGPAAARAPPTEPAAARNAPGSLHPSPVTRPANPTPNTAAPASPPTGKQAFLKHANASQGITEPLIEEALKVYGAIEKVEIDKRKGFAYVDFADSEGLAKAIAASPVTVAQGAVQVLERKEKISRRAAAGLPYGPANRGRGGFGPRGRGGRGGRGGGHLTPTPAPIPVAPAGGDAAT